MTTEITTKAPGDFPFGPMVIYSTRIDIEPQPDPYSMFETGPVCEFDIGPAPLRLRVIATLTNEGPADQPNAARAVMLHRRQADGVSELRDVVIPLVDGDLPVEYSFEAEFAPGSHKIIIASANFTVGLCSILVG